ncbi:hypothetical protein EV363DRAFT_1351890, partial [Boletus edulis]
MTIGGLSVPLQRTLREDLGSRFRVVARRGVWGIITDSRGKSLDFGLGRSHGENYGFIAASKDVHGQVLAGVQQALAEV